MSSGYRTNRLRMQGGWPLDPIEILPPELSTYCFQEVLFASNSYTYKLLELTSISKQWQHFLLSAPVLWTEIHINWSEHDLLSTVALFIHVSSKAPLTLTIWDQPRSKWREAQQLLLPQANRIKRCSFKSSHDTEETFTFASTIISSLCPLPDLMELDFGRHMKGNLEQAKLAILLSLIKPGSDSTPKLDNLTVTNIFSLDITGEAFRTVATPLQFPRLRKLHILPDSLDASISINSEMFPRLCELIVEFYGPPATLGVSTLSSLESITLRSGSLMNCQGNRLCAEILYHPERLPSLQRLHFHNFVEWDILYLMLEGRNFGICNVRKICQVTLPFVPSGLRPSFAHLLKGERTERPSNLELSLDATREVLWDPNVPGCFYCVKNMRPNCLEAVEPFAAPIFDVVHPELGKPPNTVPPAIRDWMLERESLVKKWYESTMCFARESLRAESCSRYR